ncbi:MAG TPA: endonuclease, partial [Roseiflexaceae bacterium]|nr:endonuclease [Roseiflexaceae bacterium]
EGLNVVEFYSVDNAGNVEPSKSITVKVTTFPSTSLLDNFNRANGLLGSNWSGSTTSGQYRILSQQVDVGLGGPLYWAAASFGANQEAFMRLSAIDPRTEHHTLMLKVKNNDVNKGGILVSYDAKRNRIIVEALKVGQGWKTVAAFPATLANGDTLGARALADGKVRVYVNCVFVGQGDTTTQVGSAYVNVGGRIGVWYLDAPNAVFDNFGGGTAP